MKYLENMDIGHRVMLTVAVVVILLILVACVGYFTGGWEEQGSGQPFSLASAESRPEPMCMDDATREQIKTVMLDALDTALKQHVVHAFEVWMRDNRAQPERARTGVVNGINAYLTARKGAIEWVPPLCAG